MDDMMSEAPRARTVLFLRRSRLREAEGPQERAEKGL